MDELMDELMDGKLMTMERSGLDVLCNDIWKSIPWL